MARELIEAFLKFWEEIGEKIDRSIEITFEAAETTALKLEQGRSVALNSMTSSEESAQSPSYLQNTKSVFFRACRTIGTGMGYIFSPNVINTLALVSAAVMIISNPVGWGFGAAAAVATCAKIGYEYYKKASNLQERKNFDRELSMLESLEKCQQALLEKLGPEKFASLGLKNPPLEAQEDTKEPKSWLGKVASFIGGLRPIIFLKEISVGAFAIAAAVITLNIPAAAMAATSMISGIIGENTGEAKTEAHLEKLEEQIAIKRAQLGLSSTNDVEAALAKNVLALNILNSGAKLEAADLSDERITHQKEQLTALGLPPRASFASCVSDAFASGISFQATRSIEQVRTSTSDDLVANAVTRSAREAISFNSYNTLGHEPAQHISTTSVSTPQLTEANPTHSVAAPSPTIPTTHDVAANLSNLESTHLASTHSIAVAEQRAESIILNLERSHSLDDSLVTPQNIASSSFINRVNKRPRSHSI